MDVPVDPTTVYALIAYALGTSTSEQVREPIAKLVMTVRDFVGWGFEPRRIRAIAEAEADAKIIEARGDVQVQKIKAESRLELQDIRLRAANTANRTQERQQRNIESIVIVAAGEIPDKVSESPVDPDWTAQFFDDCRNVSDPQMQAIWSRLLAGEVSAPGSYSLRTLHTVKLFSKRDAELFSRFCQFVWMVNGTPYAILPNLASLKIQSGIEFSHVQMLQLESLGLIKFDESLPMMMDFAKTTVANFEYFGRSHLLSSSEPKALELGVAFLTDVGQELALIAGESGSEEYRNWIVTTFRSQGWNFVESDID